MKIKWRLRNHPNYSDEKEVSAGRVCWWVIGYIAAYIFKDMLKSFCAAQDFMCVSVCTRRLLFPSTLKVCWYANPTSKKVSMDTFRFRFLISWLRDKCPLSKLKANLFLRRKTLFPMYYAPIPYSRKWPPTPVFLPGESHEQRSL